MADVDTPGHHTHIGPAPPGFGGLTGGIFGFPQQLPQPVPPPPAAQQFQQQQYISDTPLYIAGARPKEKSWGELFIYNTGCSYFTGITTGGMIGAGIGLWRVQRDVNWKLKLNSILNSSSKYGGNTANSFAVFAMIFSGTRYLSQRMRNGVNDRYNDIYGITLASFVSAISQYGVLRASVAATAVGGVAAAVTEYRNRNAVPYEEVYDLRNVKALNQDKHPSKIASLIWRNHPHGDT
jgi:hypothetical protein